MSPEECARYIRSKLSFLFTEKVPMDNVYSCLKFLWGYELLTPPPPPLMGGQSAARVKNREYFW